jgi:hypothetical protein
MGLPEKTYHRVPLSALGVELMAAFLPETQALWFPVATVCEALQLDLKYHRGKVQREYKELTDKLRLPTDGGPQEQICIEWTALAHWLSTIQGGKTTSDTTRGRLRTFRANVMAAASLILLGQVEAIALVERKRPRGANSVMLEHDARLAQLERAVFVGEPEEGADADPRVGHCPYCGGAIAIDTQSIAFVRADN